MKAKSLAITIIVTSLLFSCTLPGSKKQVANFKECVAAGYPVMESYPRQCRTPDGRNFVEDIPNGVGKPPQNEPTACTLESKLCPDGSAVGRTGPNCEFSPCPGE